MATRTPGYIAPALQSLNVPIDSVTPHPRNVNTGDVDAISRSLEQFAQYAPIVVQRSTGHIVKGNHTYLAARALGWTEIAANVMDLDDTQALAVLVGDNRHSALGTRDQDALAVLLTELAEADALLGTGYDGDDVDAILAELAGPVAGLTDPDAVPGVPDEPITKPGDAWQMGDHWLTCGDSRTLALSCAALVFDPPFDADPALIALRWPCRDVLVFTDHRHTLDAVDRWGQPFRNLFAWDGQTSWYVKGQPLARGKFCLWFGASEYDADGAHYGEPGIAHEVSNPRGKYDYRPDPRGKHLATIFSAPATRQHEGHAHAKPVDWVRCLLANCTRGDIGDPFAGSGTSLIAAELLGRRWVGNEIDPATCDVIVRRWEEFTGDRATRVPAGAGG